MNSLRSTAVVILTLASSFTAHPASTPVPPPAALAAANVNLAAQPPGQNQPPVGVAKKPASLYVDDGQLISHTFFVHVSDTLTEDMKPVLHFKGSHWLTESDALEKDSIPPTLVAPHQARLIAPPDKVPNSIEWTLLAFDLSGYKIPMYKSARRLVPVVTWTDADGKTGETERKAVAENEIYLGNMPGAVLWTTGMIIVLLSLLGWWSWSKAKEVMKANPRLNISRLLFLLTGPDGFLSLWRTQLALWTLAVAGVVFLFGLLRLSVPEIPESLVALMGMSLLTGTLSANKAKKDANAGPAATTGAVAPLPPPPPPPPVGGTLGATTILSALVILPPVNPNKPEFGDLISAWNTNFNRVELSLPKAQMVVWTVIVLSLFVVKSILLGALWEVPWQLVALTGFSQAGYIGDKYIQSQGNA